MHLARGLVQRKNAMRNHRAEEIVKFRRVVGSDWLQIIGLSAVHAVGLSTRSPRVGVLHLKRHVLSTSLLITLTERQA